jgi:hypothetical protein
MNTNVNNTTTTENNVEVAALMAKLEALKAENAKLKAKRQDGPVKLSTSKGGELMLTRKDVAEWPARHTKSMWLCILANADSIREYITANDADLVKV